MGLLLILPLLVSGYLVCLNDRFVFSRLHRYEGQLLYFLAAYQGLKCFGAAFAIVSVLAWATGGLSLPLCVPMSEKCVATNLDLLQRSAALIISVDPSLTNKAQIFSFFILVGCLTCVMPYVFAFFSYKYYIFNFFLRKGAYEEILGEKIAENAPLTNSLKAEARGILKSKFGNFLAKDSIKHHPIASVLVQSLTDSIPIMATMEDRKVYVGFVTAIGSMSEVSSPLENFGVLPVLSGYRDKDTLKVIFTYKYPVADEASGKGARSGVDAQPSEIFLKLENISSITRYDKDLRSKVIENPFPESANQDLAAPQVNRLEAVRADEGLLGLLRKWFIQKIS
ncbi:hypothetical protein VDQ16_06970 [Xanthomonas campestris pv. campestris]|nr:hypothetical protein [Xanthomonas campestris pv. campestris]MEB1259581.1 hypothetical protein [Xanthomonas campestris pv. campestris]MEB1300339.1 hypothetical protein [Xanthomonas campestris pv. campestris]MEB1308854.1 hypothetical protein [Xanthomonas campestris pv. campestris]MEB1322236.1 hypothetical protein [Xanthomonas campestris pv. campestris]